jgi:hypothetical protein
MADADATRELGGIHHHDLRRHEEHEVQACEVSTRRARPFELVSVSGSRGLKRRDLQASSERNERASDGLRATGE